MFYRFTPSKIKVDFYKILVLCKKIRLKKKVEIAGKHV